MHPSSSQDVSRINLYLCWTGTSKMGAGQVIIQQTSGQDSFALRGRTGRSECCKHSVWPGLHRGCCGWLAWACRGMVPGSSQSQLCSAGRHPFHIEIKKREKKWGGHGSTSVVASQMAESLSLPPAVLLKADHTRSFFFPSNFNCIWWFSCLINRLLSCWFKTAIGLHW